MKIGIISDTHDNMKNISMFLEIMKSHEVELLIHLGDFSSPFAFKSIFSSYQNRGYAVFGNNDGDRVVLTKMAMRMGIEVAESVNPVSIGGRRFFLMHGFGSPELTSEIAEAVARSGKYDYVLFGHTHSLRISQMERALLINPGEASGALTQKATAVILEIPENRVEVVEL
ncbi:metallophosphoesterase [Fervidicoccus fontis]|uniref:Phosphoesterase n=1 Tax=Fervidicoccus fontis (strain DSM 19380 / JCM 18336 / VKM B-2539 / Kam940) TaxID=1163730 RepID=I0A303_FERFK|nr:metallophosphoesterase [Fervidicoccus fontis]AFH43360.1 phosphoesterase [Fervidicoccus fontis Kam940]